MRTLRTLASAALALAFSAAVPASPFPFADPGLTIAARNVTRVRAAADGTVVFAGTFTQINGTAKPPVGKLRPDGTWDSAWAPAITGTVADVQIAGSYAYVATATPNQVKRVSLATGVVDTGWTVTLADAVQGGLFIDEAADSLYVGVVGGARKFTLSTQQAVTAFAPAFVAPPNQLFVCESTPYVTAFAKDDAGRLYVGGFFETVGGQVRNGFARISATTGAVDTTWTPATLAAPPGAEDPAGKLTGACSDARYYKVRGMVHRGGYIHAAGEFSYQGRVSIGRFATAGAGAVDTALVSPLTVSIYAPTVYDVAMDADGNVFFSSLHKFFANGARDYSWAPTSDSLVKGIAVYSGNGKVIVGGDFSAISSQLRSALARLPDRNGATADDIDGDGIPNAVEAAEGRNATLKDNDIFTNARLFSMQQYRDFLGREGDAGGITGWTSYITGGGTRASVVEGFFASAEFQGTISPVARLYFAYFLRIPDYDGLQYWIGQYRAGMPLTTISQAFAGSAEFVARYGALDNTQFVTLVYQNVLGRAPDAAGLAFWVGQLAGGMTRGTMMTGFSESAEYVAAIRSEISVTMTYIGMLRRAPDQGGFDFWVPYLDQGNSQQALINGFLAAQEYRSRFMP